jgi:hypothetical protein
LILGTNGLSPFVDNEPEIEAILGEPQIRVIRDNALARSPGDALGAANIQETGTKKYSPGAACRPAKKMQ